VLRIGSAPQQSLAVLLLLVVVLILDILGVGIGNGFGVVAAAGTIVLGILFGGGLIVSAPPLPPAPTKAYELPIDRDGCRRPAQVPQL
jgi:hypothetical protein